jgi:hypothetical protein
MKTNSVVNSVVALLSELVVVFVTLTFINAAFDTINGPVVIAAQRALEINNINNVLIWGQGENEDKPREAFAQTIKMRNLSLEAKYLANTYFFETLVGIQRAEEGVA